MQANNWLSSWRPATLASPKPTSGTAVSASWATRVARHVNNALNRVILTFPQDAHNSSFVLRGHGRPPWHSGVILTFDNRTVSGLYMVQIRLVEIPRRISPEGSTSRWLLSAFPLNTSARRSKRA